MKYETAFTAIYENPEFDRLVWKRRKLVIWLMLLSMSVYFTTPILGGLFPNIMSIKVVGSINFGLLYSVGQYFFGAAIAIYYACSLKALDKMASSLVSAAVLPGVDNKNNI